MLFRPDKKYLPVLVAVFGALLLIGAAAVARLGNAEARIKREIAKANYCEAQSDCVVVPSQCPFDCYAAVNKGEADRIKKLIDGYASTCIYSCVELKGVMCVHNKCELVR